ncbi:hypothetical protein PTSG_13100 [Salpingoeca rosetta]|uniref:Uncharacterized protein n=1 Tax=Salpingoeca rosetta (strain ATCC 50818 / BSB-021) TaxID=946362 RepID=F2URG3_SALR5|nr:uncharacterized protein PTSG_13100 [Salpingoeca rosetta]EGD80132.1 hypothetical protein PTSG_13100 [Salpingoeca rosetta]|eukprot:XP_004988194.1 hypothetical protein PTSG_13100 [Salpingoeca rosetta]
MQMSKTKKKRKREGKGKEPLSRGASMRARRMSLSRIACGHEKPRLRPCTNFSFLLDLGSAVFRATSLFICVCEVCVWVQAKRSDTLCVCCERCLHEHTCIHSTCNENSTGVCLCVDVCVCMMHEHCVGVKRHMWGGEQAFARVPVCVLVTTRIMSKRTSTIQKQSNTRHMRLWRATTVFAERGRADCSASSECDSVKRWTFLAHEHTLLALDCSSLLTVM